MIPSELFACTGHETDACFVNDLLSASAPAVQIDMFSNIKRYFITVGIRRVINTMVTLQRTKCFYFIPYMIV